MLARMVLALDQGTSSSRAILFDEEAKPVATGQREFPQRYPQPGWVEHDPEAIWASLTASAEEALRAGLPAAIGITNQRETTLVWDRRDGKPVYPAIVWQDRRTSARCEELRERAVEIQAKTGLVLDPYFSATKIEWILREVPGARQLAEAGHLAFGTVDSYLLWRLTKGVVHATDVTNASRTMLWNLERGEWDAELLDLFGVPERMLPEVKPSISDFGETSQFGKPIPIRGIAGDQQAASFGQGCFEPGMVKNTYGTGCFLLMVTGDTPPQSPNRLLGTAACPLGAGRLFALEGSVFVAGAAVQWLRDGLGLIASASECEALARSVPDTAGVSFVPAFTGLGAPYWDADARGLICGLTRGATKAHVVRACLESVAHQVQDVLEATALPVKELRVDGGMVGNSWLMQFQADLSGVPIRVPRVAETTALGAALLAGLGAAVWTSSDVERITSEAPSAVYEPRMGDAEQVVHRERWRDAVRRAG